MNGLDNVTRKFVHKTRICPMLTTPQYRNVDFSNNNIYIYNITYGRLFKSYQQFHVKLYAPYEPFSQTIPLRDSKLNIAIRTRSNQELKTNKK